MAKQDDAPYWGPIAKALHARCRAVGVPIFAQAAPHHWDPGFTFWVAKGVWLEAANRDRFNGPSSLPDSASNQEDF